MDRNEKRLLLFGAVTLFLVAMLTSSFLSGARRRATQRQMSPNTSQAQPTGGTQQATPAVLPAVVTTTTEPKPVCGDVKASCNVSAEARISVCNRQKAEKQLSSMLEDPETLEGCSSIRDELAENCPSDCELARRSIIVINGDINVTLPPFQDDDGSCEVRGSRSMIVRGTCIPKPS